MFNTHAHVTRKLVCSSTLLCIRRSPSQSKPTDSTNSTVYHRKPQTRKMISSRQFHYSKPRNHRRAHKDQTNTKVKENSIKRFKAYINFSELEKKWSFPSPKRPFIRIIIYLAKYHGAKPREKFLGIINSKCEMII